MTLDELAGLAEASTRALGGGKRRWLDRYEIEQLAMPQCDREYIAAADPTTILKLIAVAKAAKAMVARVDQPQWFDLRDAINALEAT